MQLIQKGDEIEKMISTVNTRYQRMYACAGFAIRPLYDDNLTILEFWMLIIFWLYYSNLHSKWNRTNEYFGLFYML